MSDFSLKRLVKFTRDHRTKTGQLPTLKDFAAHGFSETEVKAAEKKKLIEQFYVTLTTGAVVKGYKPKA